MNMKKCNSSKDLTQDGLKWRNKIYVYDRTDFGQDDGDEKRLAMSWN